MATNRFGKVTLTLAALSDLCVVGLNGAILAVSLAVFLSCWSISNDQFFKKQSVNLSLGADYTKYMMMADMTVHTPGQMYDLESQRQWFAKNVSAERYKTMKAVNPSYYPPPFCLACVPWLSLNFPQGLLSWSIAQVLLLCGLVMKFVRKSPIDWLYFWIIVLSAFGIRFGVILGQTAFLVAVLTVGLYYCWLKDRQFTAGFLLALCALVKPHHCLVPFVMIVSKRQWKTFISFAITLLVVGVISVAAFGPALILNYPGALHAIEQETITHWRNYDASLDVAFNLRCILTLMMPGEMARQIGNISVLLDVILCYWIWRKSLARGPETFPFALMTTTAISLVCNLHSNSYDLTLLIFPCALTIEAVGMYAALARDDIRFRLWCVSFPVFWTFSQLHCSFSSAAVNWHLLYITLYAALAYWYWNKTLMISRNEEKRIA